MFSSAILDLQRQRTWEPSQLTAEAFRWPVDFQEVMVRDIAARLVPRSFAEAGAPVIGPADIDPSSGGVRQRSRKYQGSVYQVGAELRQGDVLLPRTGLGPAVLVSEHLRGALVSARFHALRPAQEGMSLWLWGLLSCESGRRWRATLSSGTAASSTDVKLVLAGSVPVPQPGRLRIVADRLRVIHAATRIPEAEAVETWWQIADLRIEEWRIALATPDPAALTRGDPLGDYFGEILRGRNTRVAGSDSEVTGHLPVADVSVLSGKPPRRWLDPDKHSVVVAEPGDVLVAVLGNHPYATVADARLVADQHVAVLRLLDTAQGPALARYLNSQAGYRLRQVFLTGSTVPSLRLTDLKRFPVPRDVLVLEEPADPKPLSTRLEEVLWES